MLKLSSSTAYFKRVLLGFFGLTVIIVSLIFMYKTNSVQVNKSEIRTSSIQGKKSKILTNPAQVKKRNVRNNKPLSFHSFTKKSQSQARVLSQVSLKNLKSVMHKYWRIAIFIALIPLVAVYIAHISQNDKEKVIVDDKEKVIVNDKEKNLILNVVPVEDTDYSNHYAALAVAIFLLFGAIFLGLKVKKCFSSSTQPRTNFSNLVFPDGNNLLVYKYSVTGLITSFEDQFRRIFANFKDSFSLAYKYEIDIKAPESKSFCIQVIPYGQDEDKPVTMQRASWTCYRDPGDAVSADLKRIQANKHDLTSNGIIQPTGDKRILREKFKLALLGNAIGDAYGSPFENGKGSFLEYTKAPLKFTERDSRVHEGLFTDDFSQALILAHSLIEHRAIDGKDIYEKSLRWFDEKDSFMAAYWVRFGQGKSLKDMSENGGLMDIENLPSFGNGCIMRISPIILFYMFHSKEALMEAAAASTLSIYPNVSCRDASRLMASIMYYIFHHDVKCGKDLLKSEFKDLFNDYWSLNPPSAYFKEVIDNISNVYHSATEGFMDQLHDAKARSQTKTRTKNLSKNHRGRLYALSAHCTMFEAIYALITTDNLMDGLNAACNTHDADTVGAVFLTMALPIYGIQNINDWATHETAMPRILRDNIYAGPAIDLLGNVLFDLALDHNADLSRHVHVKTVKDGVAEKIDGVILNSGKLRDFQPTYMPAHLHWYKMPYNHFQNAQDKYYGPEELPEYQLLNGDDIKTFRKSEYLTKPPEKDYLRK